jgi:hypothetical protein
VTTFTLKLEGKSLEHAYDSAELYKNLQDILTKYTLRLQRDIAINTPVDTGILGAAIYPIVEGLIGSVSPIGECKKYAPFVEYDTRPHWPPIAAMEGWAHRHGLSAYLVARAISIHGTKGAHMFEQGINNVDTDAMIEEISAAIGAAWAD